MCSSDLHAGATPTGKNLRGYLARHADAARILLDPAGRGWDDTSSATLVLRGDEAATAHALAAHARPAEASWLSRWQQAEARAHEVPSASSGWEASVAQAVAESGRPVWAGSSLPVRDLDRYVAPHSTKRQPITWANRGASGIDGVLSSAAGASAVAGDVVAYVGDLSFQHDVGGLAAVSAHAPRLTIVVANNGGGAIFDHLPVAGHVGADELDRLIVMPQSFDLGRACQAFGVPHARVHADGSAARLGAVLRRTRAGVVEVMLDRSTCADRRREHAAAVVTEMDRLVATWRSPARGRKGQAKATVGRTR